jgi:hypothetical protein
LKFLGRIWLGGHVLEPGGVDHMRKKMGRKKEESGGEEAVVK